MAPEYKHNLELEDYKEMSHILGGLKAKFILSINDHREMRETFKDFNFKPVTLKYTVAEKKATVGRELLISNF
jgi:DNA adenine methylase